MASRGTLGLGTGMGGGLGWERRNRPFWIIRIDLCGPGAGGGTCPAGMTASVGCVHLRVKKIGFLSFGHWSEAPGSQVRSASDSLLQSVELAVAAEEPEPTARTSACITSRGS